MPEPSFANIGHYLCGSIDVPVRNRASWLPILRSPKKPSCHTLCSWSRRYRQLPFPMWLGGACGESWHHSVGAMGCREPSGLYQRCRGHPGAGLTLRPCRSRRRQARASSCSPAVPPTCHKQRSRAVCSGHSRSLPGGRCAGRTALTWGGGGGRHCMACKGSGGRIRVQKDCATTEPLMVPGECSTSRPA